MWAVTNPVASEKIRSQLHSFAIFLPAEDFGRASCSSLSISFPHDGSTSSAALAAGECPVLPWDSTTFPRCCFPRTLITLAVFIPLSKNPTKPWSKMPLKGEGVFCVYLLYFAIFCHLRNEIGMSKLESSPSLSFSNLSLEKVLSSSSRCAAQSSDIPLTFILK